MAKKETEREILEMVRSEMNTAPNRWYKSKCCAKSRAEFFAKAILENDWEKTLGSIPRILRERPYFIKGHDKNPDREVSNRLEEHIALHMIRHRMDYPAIGEIVDYQVPLKKTRNDYGVGKIDLVAYDHAKKTVRLLEMKRPNSEESLLRAVLEIYTYAKQIQPEKFIEGFYKMFPEPDQLPLPSELKIQPTVLLFENSYGEREYRNADSYTRKLMDALGVDFMKFSLEFHIEKSEAEA